MNIVNLNIHQEPVILVDGLTLDDIKAKYSWLLNARTKNAIIGEESSGQQIAWYGGEWLDGEWFDGVWYAGIWHRGIWEKGSWYAYKLNREALLDDRFVVEEDDDKYSHFLSGRWLTGNFYRGIFGYGHSYWSGQTQYEIEVSEFKSSCVNWVTNDSDAIWENGRFHNGRFINAEWLNGHFLNGCIYNSRWRNGDFFNGYFEGYDWYEGRFFGGDFLKGIWYNGEVNEINPQIPARIGSTTVDKQEIQVEWYDGFFRKGSFHSGLVKDASGNTIASTNHYMSRWYNGTFENGQWYGGNFEDGKWLNGQWFGGVWGTWSTDWVYPEYVWVEGTGSTWSNLENLTGETADYASFYFLPYETNSWNEIKSDDYDSYTGTTHNFIGVVNASGNTSFSTYTNPVFEIKAGVEYYFNVNINQLPLNFTAYYYESGSTSYTSLLDTPDTFTLNNVMGEYQSDFSHLMAPSTAYSFKEVGQLFQPTDVFPGRPTTYLFNITITGNFPWGSVNDIDVYLEDGSQNLYSNILTLVRDGKSAKTLSGYLNITDTNYSGTLRLAFSFSFDGFFSSATPTSEWAYTLEAVENQTSTLNFQLTDNSGTSLSNSTLDYNTTGFYSDTFNATIDSTITQLRSTLTTNSNFIGGTARNLETEFYVNFYSPLLENYNFPTIQASGYSFNLPNYSQVYKGFQVKIQRSGFYDKELVQIYDNYLSLSLDGGSGNTSIISTTPYRYDIENIRYGEYENYWGMNSAITCSGINSLQLTYSPTLNVSSFRLSDTFQVEGRLYKVAVKAFYQTLPTWQNGTWYNGLWINGTFEQGEIRGGTFLDGDIQNAIFT